MRHGAAQGRSRRRGLTARTVGAAFLMLAAAPGAPAQPSVDAEVDLALGGFDDALLSRLLTELPESWPAPRGVPPFKQEPPAAQDDFREPPQPPPQQQQPPQQPQPQQQQQQQQQP